MAYPGGKAGAGVYQKIINQIPPHDLYIEPFLGDGAIMRKKRPAELSIGVELDPDVAAAFSRDSRSIFAESDGSSRKCEVYCCDGIEWLRHAFGLYRVAAASGAGSRGPAGRSDVVDSAESLDAAAKYFAAQFGDVGRVFIYIDPPYLMSTRRSGKLYRFEMSDQDHERLLRVVTQLPCCVAISGYWSELYGETLASWRLITFEAMTRGGKIATECLWMNYTEPDELHDYSFLGDEKRERERIGRKVRNWKAGLERLPNLERLAIMNAITGR